MLEALAAGSAGERPDGLPSFYGVVGIEGRWRAARESGSYLYLDNAYLDAGRGKFFRVGRNALQTLSERPDFGRLRALGVEIKPWRQSGRHVLVVEQSPYFMEHVAEWPGGIEAWRRDLLLRLAAVTDRQIIVRHWSRDKAERARTLSHELENAWAVVAHGSAAANEAILNGVPAFVTSADCAAREMAGELDRIECPRYPDRDEWLAKLAASQWTLEEMRSGLPWRT